MRRHAQVEWALPQEITWELVPVALLMDIRALLTSIDRKLAVLDCPDFRAIPHRLDKIAVNTRRKRKRVAR